MGVKEGGAPPMTVEEVVKMVKEGQKIERKKLYHDAHLLKIRPAYNTHAKEHMAFAPWYPEMNEVGYDHKVHGTYVVPDYRVYQVARTAAVSPVTAQYVQDLEAAGLKDPWIRNELWRLDPYGGMFDKKQSVIDFFKKPLLIGVGLALTHYVFRKTYDYFFPPVHKETDKWWELRETPEPNLIYNRIKPTELIFGLITVSKNPKMMRRLEEEYGVEKKPPLPHYKKENDPALVGLPHYKEENDPAHLC